MGASPATESTIALGDIRPLRQLREFTSWVGEGRALTQAGRMKLADARELVTLLATGDELDACDGMFPITSSADLPGLLLIVEWAKACRLVRVARGRIVSVKKSARLLDRPAQLWARMFETVPLLGETLCPGGWSESLMRDRFAEAIEAVLEQALRRGGTITIDAALALAWEVSAGPSRMEWATEQQRTVWRAMNDRDVRHALQTLELLGALRRDADDVSLTVLGLAAARRAAGEAEPGDAILQLKIALFGARDPAVWRRVLVPANTRLDRLHGVIQAAMGWEDYHLHAFSARGADYGPLDAELGHRDERRTALGSLVAEPGDRMRYTYDFGDDWEHEIVVEKVLGAEPRARYPICVAGKGRCPPEDCGGVWGYASLRDALAHPRHEEHADMLDWLGLQAATEFDPAAFDIDEVNAVLVPGAQAEAA